MAKVYLVTDGDYSDYHVVAAFTTEALAEAFVAWYGSGLVEEYELDEVPQLMRDGTHQYHVRMWRDGDCEVERASSFDLEPTTYSFRCAPRFGRISRHYEHNLSVYVITKSKEQAVKIANETRTQLIANGQWPEE